MTPTYSIRDWSKHFENNRTRELKELRFVILPNKHDGDGYTELLDHPNGAAHYGAWVAIVQVASKCDSRGTLSRNVGTIPQEGAATSQEAAVPHDARSLSRLTRIPASVFEEVLPRLVSIGWLETATPQVLSDHQDRTIPQGVGTIPHPPAEKRPRTERKRIEEKVVPFPNGNGVQQSQDFSLWKLALGKLMATGMEEQPARSFLAKLSKDYGKTTMAEAVTEMLSADPIEPKSYLVDLLKRKKADGGEVKLTPAQRAAKEAAIAERMGYAGN